MLTCGHLGMFAAILVCSTGLSRPSAAYAESAAKIEIKRSIVYKTLESGTKLLADVYLPAADEGPHATLLMIHGGAWFSGNKAHVTNHAKHAATRGYAVMAINYRLAPQFKFPAQLEDCRDALKWISDHADQFNFDENRVGVYGYSAGAHLACLVGVSQNPTAASVAEAPPAPRVRAIVAGGAPCEFSWIPNQAKTLAYWLGDSRAASPEVYAAASPLEFVDPEDPPVFLFHGTADRVVPLQCSRKMSDRLIEADVTSQLHLVEEASHLGAFLDETAREKAILFLDQHLRR